MLPILPNEWKAIKPTHKNFDVFKESHIRNLNAILKLPELFKKAVYVDSMAPQKTKNKTPHSRSFIISLRLYLWTTVNTVL